MTVGGHVDRDALDAGREVRAVVQVEAAKEVLIRLAVAGVLRDDQAGHDLQQFPHPQEWPVLKLFGEHRAFAGRSGRPGQCDPARLDDDLLQIGPRDAAGDRCSRRAERRQQDCDSEDACISRFH